MAYIASSQQSDNDQQKQPGQPIPIGPSAAPSGPGAQSSSSSAAPTVQGAPSSSGRFSNIQNYLNANKSYNNDGWRTCWSN
jgi:hypothetical protein